MAATKFSCVRGYTTPNKGTMQRVDVGRKWETLVEVKKRLKYNQ